MRFSHSFSLTPSSSVVPSATEKDGHGLSLVGVYSHSLCRVSCHQKESPTLAPSSHALLRALDSPYAILTCTSVNDD